MRSQGIDIDVDVTPSTPTTGDDDEESGPGIEEESEEEDFTDDESIQAYIWISFQKIGNMINFCLLIGSQVGGGIILSFLPTDHNYNLDYGRSEW